MLPEDRHRIRSGTDKGRVPKAHHAAIAQNEVEATGDHGIDQDARKQASVKDLTAEGGSRRERQKSHTRQYDAGLSAWAWSLRLWSTRLPGVLTRKHIGHTLILNPLHSLSQRERW